ncbi:GDSL esterase/lipase-like [Iris pallida]|uniref:GDSL esterase/lipase-like n=1 Tax=Iris pallida TaxID=29817 RepID=A0AAX6IJN8_IRIPA|nr:GDSL esterase/lipase-like [Iris pallida]
MPPLFYYAAMELSLLLLLPLMLLLVSSTSGSCNFPAIITLGDSNSDTGGLSASFGPVPPPYGITFFRQPAGRYSDGRLIIDFIERLRGRREVLLDPQHGSPRLPPLHSPRGEAGLLRAGPGRLRGPLQPARAAVQRDAQRDGGWAQEGSPSREVHLRRRLLCQVHAPKPGRKVRFRAPARNVLRVRRGNVQFRLRCAVRGHLRRQRHRGPAREAVREPLEADRLGRGSLHRGRQQVGFRPDSRRRVLRPAELAEHGVPGEERIENYVGRVVCVYI